MKKAKKVIILDKIESPAISQAIFILRDEDANEFSALYEAERIVEDYLANRPISRKKNFIPLFFAVSAFLATAFFLVYLIF